MRTRVRVRAVLLLLGASVALGGCAALGGSPRSEPLHLSDLSDAGDPAFRASLRLVLDGLEADEAGRPDAALVLYERALQVDSINPYAYLAIARHRVEGEDPESGLPFLDKAETLLESRGELTPGAAAHIAGLRGTALLASGRQAEAFQLFEEARTLDPLTWSDGRLSPSELR